MLVCLGTQNQKRNQDCIFSGRIVLYINRHWPVSSGENIFEQGIYGNFAAIFNSQ